MMNPFWLRKRGYVLGLAAAALMLPSTADAQIQRVSNSDSRNAIGFNIGYFAVKSLDAREVDEIVSINTQAFTIQTKDFNNVTFGAEWLFRPTDYIEAGFGIDYYKETVPSVYRDYFNVVTGGEVAQDFTLRVIPMTATVRFLPLGRSTSVEPYIGVGIGAFNWRYTEQGEFIDFSDGTVFPGKFSDDGTAVGPVVLGGIRVPVANVFALGGEFRWQDAKGKFDTSSQIPADHVDLGGWTTRFTFHFRF